MRDWCEEQGDRLRGKKQDRVPGIGGDEKWPPYWRAALAVAVALLLIVTAGFAFGLAALNAVVGAARPPARVSPAGPKVYLRAELERKVRGRTADQLREILGDPDGYDQGGDYDYYTYKQRTRPAEGQEPEKWVIILVSRGRVTYFIYSADPPIQLPG